MPTYVHGYLRHVPSEPGTTVLLRDGKVPAVAFGSLMLAGGAVFAVAPVIDAEYRTAALVTAGFTVLMNGLMLFGFARSERVTFDGRTSQVTLADGTVVPFGSIHRLVVLTSRDSDSDDAYGLALDTAGGRHLLSSMWCWNERAVLDAARAVCEAFPSLPFDGGPVLYD